MVLIPSARRLRHILMGPSQDPLDFEISTAEEAITFLHWANLRPLRLYLPVHMLRMQGGFAFGPSNPFVRCLTEGPRALEEFYSNFKPTGMAEMYGIEKRGRAGEGLPPWKLPWLMDLSGKIPSGEKGLAISHGMTLYGPASPDKIALELARMRNTTESIRKHGYRTGRSHRSIEGYFLRSDAGLCFLVRGGKHRASALAFLKHEKIPVMFSHNWPTLVDERDAALWPLVASGEADEGLCREIIQITCAGR
jgi:hypothetical protein